MQSGRPLRAALLSALFISAPVTAAEISLQIEIPRLKVAEYHRPYLAVWLEGEKTHDLALWYDKKLKDEEGKKWLIDLRRWWRQSGRNYVDADAAPTIDAMSSATRAPGSHRLSFSSAQPPLAALPAGKYRLMIEAAREVGGRELLQQEITWPLAAAAAFRLQGKDELGSVAIELQP